MNRHAARNWRVFGPQMMKRLGLGLSLAALAAVLGGCAPSESGPSFGNVGRNFADDWTRSRSFDRALQALSHSNLQAKDLKALEAEGRSISERIENGSGEAWATAVNWIEERLPQAAQNDVLARNASSGSSRDQWRVASNRQYRAALAFLPSDEQKWRSLDPTTLNALGYFLADHGNSRADFERAEKLTSLAIELSPTRNSAERYARALGAQDSHAWALFRLGQTEAALAAQMEVMKMAGEQSADYGPPPADVVYHWGAICRVAGRENSARDAFKFAQTQNPSLELSEILEANLDGSLL